VSEAAGAGVQPLAPGAFRQIVFFTGAGMSAESGVPTYRGQGGIWHQYRWQEYACQEAFEREPQRVLDFHELRRRSVLACRPHAGHRVIAAVEAAHPRVAIITQNIDGMHQRAGSKRVFELHGSLWRLRCPRHGVSEDVGEIYRHRRCPACNAWLRPDITWFGDALDPEVMKQAARWIGGAELFVSVGTSAVVWPAAGLPELAQAAGALMLEVNPAPSGNAQLYARHVRLPAGTALPLLFPAAAPGA
jgi:NAD-dependent deacetylase